MLPEKVEQRLNDRTREYEEQNHNYIPIEITIKLASPIMAPIFPLYLDALLGNIVAQEIWGEYFGRIPTDLFIDELPLPLKKHDLKKFGHCWAASCNIVTKKAIFDMDGYQRNYPGDPWVLMKSFTPSKLADYAGVGRYKSYLERFEVIFIEEMKFYAVGIPKEINRLLSQVKFLFKKRSQGRGEIQLLSVKPIERDYTLWKDNRPMRPIPIELIQKGDSNKFELNMARLRPPYWKTDDKVLCIVPDHELWSGMGSLKPGIRKPEQAADKKSTYYDLLFD